MRLTLRNLLAYLNNIIEDPADIEEMRRKIEESEFATGLVHRIRSTTSRARLGAPSLEGRGIGLDANSIAEYLDNELPADRIPDLEKICGESDVHLAEVAACYQILALYMKGTGEVDQGLRDRICGIAETGEVRPRAAVSATDRADQSRAVRGAAGLPVAEPLPPPATMVPPAPPRQPMVERARRPFEVPEYLRVGQRGKWKPLAVTLLLAFLLSAVALRAMGPFDRNHPLMRLVGVTPSVTVSQGTAPRAAEPTGEPDAPVAEPSTTGQEPAAEATPGEPAVAPAAPVAGADAPGVRPPLDERVPAGRPDAQTPPRPPVPAAPAGEPGPAVVPGVPDEPRAPGAANPSMPPATEPAPAVAQDEHPPAAEPAVPPAAAPAPAPAAPVEVGYVKLSQPDFLVRYAAEAADWFRLPARTKLLSGDRLIVFPTYRPEIVLTPGVQVVLAGPAAVQTQPQNAQGEVELAIQYGRALIATAGVAGARIHLDLGGQKGTATFPEAAAEMGIEVARYLPPGADPEADAGLPVISIYTTIGRIEWQAAGAAATPIEQGQVRVLVGDQSQTMAVAQSPAWIQGAELRDVDRLASSALEPFVTPDRPASLTLRERTEDRKSEIRSLAARCLAHLDSFESLVKEFGDDRQRSYWTAEYDTLRQSLRRGPDAAAKVRKVLEAFTGADAANLYRLSWGYSAEQLRDGQGAKLVEFLDHDSLPIRVFAFENLQRITNKTLLYRPDLAAAQRRSSIQRWKEQLESGPIVYETLPTPLQN